MNPSSLIDRVIAELSEDELRAEVRRLASRQLTLYDGQGEEVLTMPLLVRGCRWRAGDKILEVARVEVTDGS